MTTEMALFSTLDRTNLSTERQNKSNKKYYGACQLKKDKYHWWVWGWSEITVCLWGRYEPRWQQIFTNSRGETGTIFSNRNTEIYRQKEGQLYSSTLRVSFWELEPSQTGSYHSFRRLIVKYYTYNTTSLINNCKPCISMH